MSTAQILGLGAVAGLTIFIGLPIGRMHGLDARLKCFLSSTATGLLLFLLWQTAPPFASTRQYSRSRPSDHQRPSIRHRPITSTTW